MRPQPPARATGRRAADPPRQLRLRTDSGRARSPRKRWQGEPSEGFRPRSCESRCRGAWPARVVSGRGSGLPDRRPPRHGAWRSWTSRARHAASGRRIGVRCPCRFGGGGAGAGSQGLVQEEDLEGERSPGRTVLALPVTNPVREARTRRWSKALKRPTLPVEPGSASARKGGGGSAARTRGPDRCLWMLAVVSAAVEAAGDVWRSVEQSVGQSPSNRRGRPVSPSGCESGPEGARRSVEP